MSKARSGVVSLLVLGLSACEPTPAVTAPQPQPSVVAPVAPPSSATAEPGPDLSPVSEPGDVVGVLRWKSPISSISNLASCSGFDPRAVEIGARMGMDYVLRQFMKGSFDTRKLGAVVAVDAPLDVIVMLDPASRPRPPLVAVALGLSSLDGAKVAISADGPAEEIAPGVFALKGERGIACAVAASAGATPARLVCTDKEKTLTAVAPYLARTVPGLDYGGQEIHIEARLDVLRKRYGESLQNMLGSMPGALATEYDQGDQKMNKLLLDAGTVAQQDVSLLFQDVRRVSADILTAKSGACLRATADVDFSGKTSWLAQTLTASLDQSGPPPAIFWRLPRESDTAMYQRGLDPAHFTNVIKTGRQLFESALAASNVGSPADRKKVAEIMDLPYGKDTFAVFAHGSIAAAPLPEPTSKGGAQKIVEATVERLLGWTILGVDEGPAAMKKQVKSWVDAYKLAGVQTALKKELGSDAKMLPQVKSGAAPAALGAGAEALEITVPNLELPLPPDTKDGKRPTMSLKFHLLIMPDGNTSWMAIGASRDDLVKRLVMVKQGASDKDQLSARAGLDSLKNGKQMLGGFTSIAPFGQKFAAVMQGLARLEPGGFIGQPELSFAQSLTTLPNGGQTPVLIMAGGTPGATPKLSLAIEVQQGTIENLKTLIQNNYAVLGRWGLLP